MYRQSYILQSSGDYSAS